MPQMMPIYWLVVFLLVSTFMYFFFSFYHYNLIFFFKVPSSKFRKIKGDYSFIK